MNFYLLKPKAGLPAGDNPWDPWYGKCFRMVVRAETEEQARKIANENAAEENRGEFMGKKIAKTTAPWLDLKYSTCEEIDRDGEAGLIAQETHDA